jgi:alkyldihydroxyacetonephosphate synthase
VEAAVAVAAAAHAVPVRLQCRLTHVYTDGCAPYFTVVAQRLLRPAPMLAAWDAMKEAANAAISAHGGTASHHHAGGRDHRAIYEAEVGPMALRALAAVKAAWDPAGVLNPGAIVPPRPASRL